MDSYRKFSCLLDYIFKHAWLGFCSKLGYSSLLIGTLGIRYRSESATKHGPWSMDLFCGQGP